MNLTPEEFKRIQDVLGVAIAGKIQAAISAQGSSLNVIVKEQVRGIDGARVGATLTVSSGDFANVLDTHIAFATLANAGTSSITVVRRAVCNNGSVAITFDANVAVDTIVNILVIEP